MLRWIMSKRTSMPVIIGMIALAAAAAAGVTVCGVVAYNQISITKKKRRPSSPRSESAANPNAQEVRRASDVTGTEGPSTVDLVAIRNGEVEETPLLSAAASTPALASNVLGKEKNEPHSKDNVSDHDDLPPYSSLKEHHHPMPSPSHFAEPVLSDVDISSLSHDVLNVLQNPFLLPSEVDIVETDVYRPFAPSTSSVPLSEPSNPFADPVQPLEAGPNDSSHVSPPSSTSPPEPIPEEPEESYVAAPVNMTEPVIEKPAVSQLEPQTEQPPTQQVEEISVQEGTRAGASVEAPPDTLPEDVAAPEPEAVVEKIRILTNDDSFNNGIPDPTPLSPIFEVEATPSLPLADTLHQSKPVVDLPEAEAKPITTEDTEEPKPLDIPAAVTTASAEPTVSYGLSESPTDTALVNSSDTPDTLVESRPSSPGVPLRRYATKYADEPAVPEPTSIKDGKSADTVPKAKVSPGPRAFMGGLRRKSTKDDASSTSGSPSPAPSRPFMGALRRKSTDKDQGDASSIASKESPSRPLIGSLRRKSTDQGDASSIASTQSRSPRPLLGALRRKSTKDDRGDASSISSTQSKASVSSALKMGDAKKVLGKINFVRRGSADTPSKASVGATSASPPSSLSRSSTPATSRASPASGTPSQKPSSSSPFARSSPATPPVPKPKRQSTLASALSKPLQSGQDSQRKKPTKKTTL